MKFIRIFEKYLARKDPCAPHNPCRNGRCVSNDRGGFQCKCRERVGQVVDVIKACVSLNYFLRDKRKKKKPFF